MRIKKLVLKNIRSYEAQEIEFPDSSLLLSGDICSGKTSILLALEYALFVIQPGQRGSALLRNNSDSGEVTLYLQIGEDEVIIERKLKRSEKSVTNEYAAITINGDKSEMAISELKTRIIQLLGYPEEFIKKNNILYRYTVYTPQEHMKQIISEDPEIRLNVLRHIFGVDKYKNVKGNLAILLQHMKDEIKLFKSELAFFEQEKEKLKQKDIDLIELEKKIFEKSREIEDKRQKRIEAENSLKALEEKRIERENLIKEIDKANLVISTKKEQYSSILKELKEANELVLSQKELFNEEELANAINEIKSIKEAIEVIQNELFNLKGSQKAIEQGFLETIQKKDRIFKMDICPTCLQDVSEVYKHNILNEAEKKEVDLKKQREVLSLKEQQLNAPLEELNKKLSDFEKKRLHLEVLKAKQSDVERALKQQQILEQKKSAHEKDLELLDKHLVGLKENLLTFSTFETILNKHQLSLKEALSCEKQEEINLAKLQKEKELTQKEKEELHKLLKEREGIRKKITALEEMSHWLLNNFTNLISFIEQQILLKLRYEFSRLFKKWFAILVSENFEIHLDENFSPVISHNGIEMEYSFLSGGERTAVALAYRLALNQTINSVFSRIKTKDILILDEPTEGFSSSQISKMREIFEELDIGQLIIVSHETQIEDFVENILKLKKENNLSVIEKSSS